MEYGPQNAIPQSDYGTELPRTDVPEQDLAQERNLARFSKTKEFKILKEHLEQRIEYYQTFLPSGKQVVEVYDSEKLGSQWLVANTIIGEFRAVLMAYEHARQVVEDAAKK